MRIVLIGYRGSGKTTIGRLAAEQLGLDFADVDDATCARFGIDSIAAIWQKHGEPEWRRREVEATRELCGRDGVVIGLGGGTLMQPGAREAVERCVGLRVYLKASPEVLAARIAGDPQSDVTRPSLTAHGGGVEEVRHVLMEREPVYEAVADRVMDVSGMDPAEAARVIVDWAEEKQSGR